jgi:hypothetical protein
LELRERKPGEKITKKKKLKEKRIEQEAKARGTDD